MTDERDVWLLIKVPGVPSVTDLGPFMEDVAIVVGEFSDLGGFGDVTVTVAEQVGWIHDNDEFCWNINPDLHDDGDTPIYRRKQS